MIENLWVEKYRPKNLSDVVLPDKYRNNLQRDLETNRISHYLFYGPAGSGKTTVARIITSKEGVIRNREDNLLEINGSAKECRGIGFISDTVEPFLKIPPAGNDIYRIVFIDEVDALTSQSFSSLRGIIEKYQTSHGRFIFTCNYISKVPEPIQSRLSLYKFEKIPVDFIIEYCSKILTSEHVEFDLEDLKWLINTLYPDIRKMVDTLQTNSTKGNLIINRTSIIVEEKYIVECILDLVGFIQNKENHKISSTLTKIINKLNPSLDYRSLYTSLFESKISTLLKIIVNKFANSHQDCLEPGMHFCAMIYDIIRAIQEYQKAISGK